MTIEQWYDELTEKPIIINNLIYTFVKPDGGSNLSDLEIDDNKNNRIMLSDYLLEEDDCKFSIRLKWLSSSQDKRISIHESLHTKTIGQYVYLSKDDFERAVNEKLLLVEEC